MLGGSFYTSLVSFISYTSNSAKKEGAEKEFKKSKLVKVVSTIVFSSHFSRFPPVEYVSKGLSFLSVTSYKYLHVLTALFLTT